MKPSEAYAVDVAHGLVQQDPLQERVLSAFDTLYHRLEHKVNFSWRQKLFKRSSLNLLNHHKPSEQGIYLWGSVGRGKTYLMDLFYQSLTVPKLRQHFYAFMADVHAQLKKYQGQPEPLKLVAHDIASRTQVLCFDEFFVEDIADAMILGSLFEYLFLENIVLVATSNVAPDDLYKDGLQRDRFLPAISMIKEYMHVIHLEHEQDYRLTKSFHDHRYHFPLTEADAFLTAQFDLLNHDASLLSSHFKLNQRNLTAIKRSEKIIWFEFEELCIAARSSLDYLKLCQHYQVILINHIPILTRDIEDAARRFMTLVDTCYDQHVLLVLAAAVPLSELYQGTRLNFEFARVRSRIIEMQSWNV